MTKTITRDWYLELFDKSLHINDLGSVANRCLSTIHLQDSNSNSTWTAVSDHLLSVTLWAVNIPDIDLPASNAVVIQNNPWNGWQGFCSTGQIVAVAHTSLGLLKGSASGIQEDEKQNWRRVVCDWLCQIVEQIKISQNPRRRGWNSAVKLLWFHFPEGEHLM